MRTGVFYHCVIKTSVLYYKQLSTLATGCFQHSDLSQSNLSFFKFDLSSVRHFGIEFKNWIQEWQRRILQFVWRHTRPGYPNSHINTVRRVPMVLRYTFDLHESTSISRNVGFKGQQRCSVCRPGVAVHLGRILRAKWWVVGCLMGAGMSVKRVAGVMRLSIRSALLGAKCLVSRQQCVNHICGWQGLSSSMVLMVHVIVIIYNRIAFITWTYRQEERQAGRQKDRQEDRLMEILMHRHRYRLIDRRTARQA